MCVFADPCRSSTGLSHAPMLRRKSSRSSSRSRSVTRLSTFQKPVSRLYRSTSRPFEKVSRSEELTGTTISNGLSTPSGSPPPVSKMTSKFTPTSATLTLATSSPPSRVLTRMVSLPFSLSGSHSDTMGNLVISIEASKAELKLLDVFKSHGYSNEIGPGVYDIHSPVSKRSFAVY